MCVVAVEPEPARRTPLKHMLGHVKGTLSADGHLMRMLPNNPTDGQPATIELVNISEMLAADPQVEVLRAFPGPLLRLVDALTLNVTARLLVVVG